MAWKVQKFLNLILFYYEHFLFECLTTPIGIALVSNHGMALSKALTEHNPILLRSGSHRVHRMPLQASPHCVCYSYTVFGAPFQFPKSVYMNIFQQKLRGQGSNYGMK